MKIANQIKIAKTRLKTAEKEKNPTEIEVWTSILKSLQTLERVTEVIKEG